MGIVPTSSQPGELAFLTTPPLRQNDSVSNPGLLQCKYCSFGQCVGPRICCGDIGCQMGSEEANKCVKEDEDPTPCQVFGWPCILNPGNIHGKCVANLIGICCVEGKDVWIAAI